MNNKQLMEMYLRYGLSEPFARAIVGGGDPVVIMEFWAQEWHKQYPGADDVLIIAVLEQTITPKEGEWLNSVRSNHEVLVRSCLDGSCTIEWAKSLMEAGFLNHSQEVSDILEGGDPFVIGALSGIKLDEELLPPKLEIRVSGRFRRDSQTGKPTPVGVCSACNRAIEAGFLICCPHCAAQIPWRWEGLSDVQKPYIGVFMAKHFPGISFINRDALHLMYIISVTAMGGGNIQQAIIESNTFLTSNLRLGRWISAGFDFSKILRDLDTLRHTGRL